ncbi:hypothetical protein LOC68_12360 [Blastopirellula sp. JC732]|uniref:Uncharacterized protein n=1 Tax=Blastopirellula sediminis TaxID=2894196 RepID=A0A9X1MLF4_9BACT|nr:hypothetical protein [Blastopirellula sediminis]MCC9607514.1 hypothetical protein [Blastopirellula sediminis]MCC9629193.1 hypothetical protein [Blastopirellula sediminis]
MALVLGIALIIFGCQAFTRTGLPLLPGLNITGIPAKLIGGFFLLFGIGCCVVAAVIDYSLYASFTKPE